jgi:peptide/nickel transport system substrate-binding protein
MKLTQVLRARAVVFLTGLAILSSLAVRAQDTQPGKGKKANKEEVEDTAKPIKKVIRVGDEETDTAKPESEMASLEQAARDAKNQVVRELFSSLARPHDVVRLPGGKAARVEMIPTRISTPPRFDGQLTLHPLDEKWQPQKPMTVNASGVTSVEPYEQVAVARVDAFLKDNLQTSGVLGPRPSRRDALQAAEKTLAAVIRAHWEARERGLRRGESWKAVEKTLQAKLQEVRLAYLEALGAEKQWDVALALATQISDDYRNDGPVQLQVARLLAQHVAQALDAKDYTEARRRLQVLGDRFSGSREFEPIRQQLHSRAAAILDEAKQLEKQNKSDEALARIQLAATVDPDLPGLRDYGLRLTRHYPVLSIGVRELPRELSPARAVTETEKQAVELLFESLVRLTQSAGAGQHYTPELAAELPRMAPLGRQFRLIRNAFWSNGKQVTATDVRHSVRLLSDPRWQGRVLAWSDFLEDGARIGEDAFHIDLTMRQGFMEPLALMDFKILPEQLARADDENFARSPVGSGPFMFKGIEDNAAVFLANPYYERRSDRELLPNIREVRFVVPKNPVADLEAGRVQLLLDMPVQRCRDLAGATLHDITFQTLGNRRVYFLAVNHRRPNLRSQALRRAIACGIDRDPILNKILKAGPGIRQQPLNGPYPVSSWPTQLNLPPQPFNPELARSQAEKAKAEGAMVGRLSLKFPQGDPAVAEACQAIHDQLIALNLGIELELIPRSERDLHRDVEERNDYDLAYYYWDFPNEMYWLWPLFDPRATGPGGSNFLGYQNDDELESLFRRVLTHREFSVVRDLTRRIHALLYDKMPLIPLWQLDTHVAWHNSLDIPEAIDPLRIFPGVEHWSLAARR